MAIKVKLDLLAYQKIMHWVRATDYEVSGLGKVKVDADGNVQVLDAILLPQRNTMGTTDIEPEDVLEAMAKMEKTPGDLRFWWHSHGKGGVFWSGIDRDTSKQLAAPGWFLSIVFNHEAKMKACIDINKPMTIFMDDLTVELSHPTVTPEVLAQWSEEYKENVTNVAYQRVWQGGGATGLTKKQRKALKHEERAKQNGNRLTSITSVSTDRPALVDMNKEEQANLILVDQDNENACRLCGYDFCCSCDPEARGIAKMMLEAGFCPYCELGLVKDECQCDLIEERRSVRFLLVDKLKGNPTIFRKPAPKGPPASVNGVTGGVG